MDLCHVGILNELVMFGVLNGCCDGGRVLVVCQDGIVWCHVGHK